jgi:hypothetical protein
MQNLLYSSSCVYTPTPMPTVYVDSCGASGTSAALKAGSTPTEMQRFCVSKRRFSVACAPKDSAGRVRSVFGES